MNDAIRAQISAFVDGELPENEAELLLRRMSQDKALRQQAAEYLALGRAIRGERSIPGAAGLRQRIAAEIDDVSLQQEPAPVEKQHSRFLRPLAGVAIAATVALAAIIGLQQMVGGIDIDEPAAVESVAEADNPGYTVPSPGEDQLREYYLRHAASSAHIGASSINARLVTFELRDGVLIEIEPEEPPVAETESASDEDDTPAGQTP